MYTVLLPSRYHSLRLSGLAVELTWVTDEFVGFCGLLSGPAVELTDELVGYIIGLSLMNLAAPTLGREAS